jgi:hypothetical protein
MSVLTIEDTICERLRGQKCTEQVAKRASVISPFVSRRHLLSAFTFGDLTGPENQTKIGSIVPTIMILPRTM